MIETNGFSLLDWNCNSIRLVKGSASIQVGKKLEVEHRKGDFLGSPQQRTGSIGY